MILRNLLGNLWEIDMCRGIVHVCMYACIVCMHVCMYVCMYTCMHACIHMAGDMNDFEEFVRKLMGNRHVPRYFACMYVCMHACMFVCM